ncbi:MAG: hypothetical protein MJZ13_06840 [Bacteroidales bacterium]|nr:hypothetical protein [Bacteroidales bacterium]
MKKYIRPTIEELNLDDRILVVMGSSPTIDGGLISSANEAQKTQVRENNTTTFGKTRISDPNGPFGSGR